MIHSGTRAYTVDHTVNSLEIIGSGSTPINGFIGNVLGDIFSTGESTFSGNVDFTGALVTGLLATPSGNLLGNLYGNVIGDVTGNLTGNLVGDVTGNLMGNVTGNLVGDVVGNLCGQVKGDMTGNLYAQYINAGIVCTSGRVHINEVLNSTGVGTGALTVDGGLGVAKDVWVGGNVYAPTFIGNLFGNLVGEFVGNLTGDVTGNLTGTVFGNLIGNVFGGNLMGNLFGNLQGDVTGNLYGDVVGNLCGNLKGDVVGNLVGNINGDTTVTGNLTAARNTVLGGNLLQTVVFNAGVASHLLPWQTNTYDIGSAALKWRNQWMSGNLAVDGNAVLGNLESVDTVTFNSRISSNLVPTVHGASDLGTVTNSWCSLWLSKDAFISGNLTIDNALIINGNLNSSLIPGPTNTHDLGSFTNQWRDGYLCGNLNVKGNTVLGDAMTDMLTLNATVTTSVVPFAGNAVDLGSALSQWRNLYLGSDLTVDGNTILGLGAANTIVVNARINSDVLPRIDNTSALGENALRWSSFWTHDANIGTTLADTMVVLASINSSLLPSVTNIHDLGTPPNKWRNACFGGNLAVDGNTTLGNNANVDTVLMNSKIDAPIGLLPNLDASHDIGSTLFQWRDAFLSRNLVVGGDIDLGTSVTDSITINAGVDSAVLPFTDDTYDLGSGVLKWRNQWLSGNLTVCSNTTLGDDVNTDLVIFNSKVESHVLPAVTDTYDLGSALMKWRDLQLAGDLTVCGNTTLGDDVNTDLVSFNSKVDTDLLPNGTNVHDLGSTTDNWQDLYLSSNLYINNQVVVSQRQPAVTALTDSSGGVDAGAGGVIALIGAGGLDATAADRIDTQNAVATLAGQVERALTALRNHGLIF